MKLSKIFTLLSLVFTSFAYADSAEYQECHGEGAEKSCLTYKIDFPSYPYPWLTKFVLQESFQKEEVNIESLDDLVKQYVAENIPQEPSSDSESRDWSGAEEAAGFIQIAETSSLNSDGTAHGLENVNYYVFAKENHEAPIPVEEIVADDAKEKLSQILEQNYRQWLVKHELIEKDSLEDEKDLLRTFVEDGKMPLADSWYFAKDRIVFSYSPYEIGPYSFGTIELALSINDLQGLVKTAYLQAAGEWETPFQP